jgi:hypothetical protein
MWDEVLKNKAKQFFEEDRDAPEWMKEMYNTEAQKQFVPMLS